MTKPRVLLFDIEATNLSADFGFMLAIAWKWHGEAFVRRLSIVDSPTFEKDPTNDKWLVEQFGKVLEQADVAVFHYGMYFDAPYLQTRALYHGMKPLNMPPMVDTWRICRKRLKLHSNRLASIAALLGVEEKTPLDGPTWVRAMAGNKKAIKYVVDHASRTWWCSIKCTRAFARGDGTFLIWLPRAGAQHAVHGTYRRAVK